MRSLVLLLMLANLGLYAWYLRVPVAETQVPTRSTAPPGVETLVLLHERVLPALVPAAPVSAPVPAPRAPPEQQSEPEVAPAPATVAEPPQTQVAVLAEESPAESAPFAAHEPATAAVEKSAPEPAPPPAPVKLCHTIGPFMAQQDQDAVAKWLRGENLQPKSRTSDVQEQIGYWVYLPAMPAAEAKVVAGRLADKGITDYFIGKQNYISLGAFSSKRVAAARRATIAAMGYKPRLDPRFRTRTVYWLDVEEFSDTALPEARWAGVQDDYPDARRQSLSCE